MKSNEIFDLVHIPLENGNAKTVLVKANGDKVEVTPENAVSVIDSLAFELLNRKEDVETLLNRLPLCIETPREDDFAEFECDRRYHYHFGIDKDYDNSTLYELSYYDYLWEQELISFTGPLREISEKMVEWCKENGYLKNE